MLLTQKRTLHIHSQLFTQQRKPFVLPVFDENPVEAAYDELELLGFRVTQTFYQLLQTRWRGPTDA